VVLLGIAVGTQYRAAEPIMPGWLWRHRALAGTNLAMVGLGFAVMGPNAYLPLFAQSVFGLGAVAAGLVLASMSIGWPTASALSGQLYLRIGFRNTALLGSCLIVVAGGGFLLLPYAVPVWTLVFDQVVLGAGFGLLSTSALVGAQSTVGWNVRGVVTGANMFSRFLGQSFGVAVFGAIFNASLKSRLNAAPTGLSGRLPDNVDNIMTALQGQHLGASAAAYLRHAIYAATHHLYLGLLGIAVLTVLAVIGIPRRFGMDTHS
jgi:MFS family permease